MRRRWRSRGKQVATGEDRYNGVDFVLPIILSDYLREVKMSHYLVNWVQEQKWDVFTEADARKRIPQEMHYEGALGNIVWTNGKSYLAKVVKIGGE